jgi:hypothetical protein
MLVFSLSASALPGPSPAASVPTDVGDRSTTFVPVEGGTDHRSGETLLVAAYAGLWVLLMGWVVVQWTKQTALGRRLNDLEGAVARAEADARQAGPGAKGKSAG